jgi:hypothetical protein
MIKLELQGGAVTFVNPAQIVEVTEITGGAIVWTTAGPKKTTMKASDVLELMTEPATPAVIEKKAKGHAKDKSE